jgi:hypothetical protein
VVAAYRPKATAFRLKAMAAAAFRSAARSMAMDYRSMAVGAYRLKAMAGAAFRSAARSTAASAAESCRPRAQTPLSPAVR